MPVNPWGGSMFSSAGATANRALAPTTTNYAPRAGGVNQGSSYQTAGAQPQTNYAPSAGGVNQGAQYPGQTTPQPNWNTASSNNAMGGLQQTGNGMGNGPQGNEALADLYNSQISGTTSQNDAQAAMQHMLLGLSNKDTGTRYGMLGAEAGVQLNAALRDPRFARQAAMLQNQLLTQQLGGLNLQQTGDTQQYNKGRFQINSDATGQGSYFSPSRGMNQNWLTEGYQNQLGQLALQRQGIGTQRGQIQNDLDKQLAALGDQGAIARLRQQGYGALAANAATTGLIQGQQIDANTAMQNMNSAITGIGDYYNQTGGFMPRTPYAPPPVYHRTGTNQSVYEDRLMASQLDLFHQVLSDIGQHAVQTAAQNSRVRFGGINNPSWDVGTGQGIFPGMARQVGSSLTPEQLAQQGLTHYSWERPATMYGRAMPNYSGIEGAGMTAPMSPTAGAAIQGGDLAAQLGVGYPVAGGFQPELFAGGAGTTPSPVHPFPVSGAPTGAPLPPWEGAGAESPEMMAKLDAMGFGRVANGQFIANGPGANGWDVPAGASRGPIDSAGRILPGGTAQEALAAPAAAPPINPAANAFTVGSTGEAAAPTYMAPPTSTPLRMELPAGDLSSYPAPPAPPPPGAAGAASATEGLAPEAAAAAQEALGGGGLLGFAKAHAGSLAGIPGLMAAGAAGNIPTTGNGYGAQFMEGAPSVGTLLRAGGQFGGLASSMGGSVAGPIGALAAAPTGALMGVGNEFSSAGAGQMQKIIDANTKPGTAPNSLLHAAQVEESLGPALMGNPMALGALASSITGKTGFADTIKHLPLIGGFFGSHNAGPSATDQKAQQAADAEKQMVTQGWGSNADDINNRRSMLQQLSSVGIDPQTAFKVAYQGTPIYDKISSAMGLAGSVDPAQASDVISRTLAPYTQKVAEANADFQNQMQANMGQMSPQERDTVLRYMPLYLRDSNTAAQQLAAQTALTPYYNQAITQGKLAAAQATAAAKASASNSTNNAAVNSQLALLQAGQ